MRNKYLEEFPFLKCSPDLIMWKLYPNAKEITEAMGLFSAAIQNLGHGMEACSRDARAVVFGDGRTPRLGALLAMRTRWQVVSVDPLLQPERWKQIQRLEILPDKGENIPTLDMANQNTVIFFPHSHAPMVDCLERVRNYSSRTIIVMPCCVPIAKTWVTKPHLMYRDMNVISEKNEIHIWKS